MTCPSWVVYSGYMFHVICSCLTFISIYLIYKFIRNAKANKLPKYSLVVGVLFYLSSTLSLFGSTLQGLNACLYNIEFSKWELQHKLYYIMFACFYFIQYHMMLIVLFQRLYCVFKDSVYILHKYHIISFIIIHILFVVDLAVSVIFRSSKIILFIAQTIYALLLISLIIYIASLFIKKLFKLFTGFCDTNISDNDHEASKEAANLLSVITKCTVLTCVSILISILSQLLFGFTIISLKPTFAEFFVSYIILFDVFSNLICITLTFNYADKHYERYCKYADICCRNMCQYINKTGSIDDLKMMEHEISSRSPPTSVATDNA